MQNHSRFGLTIAQAKTKALSIFTMFLTAVKKEEFNVERFTLKYFDRGHTFISADYAHAEIEEQLRRREQIFDHRILVNCVKKHHVCLLI